MKIYKYRSLEKSLPQPKNGVQEESPFDYTIELLRTNKVWHSDPKKLNDVFELKPRVEAGVNLNDLRDILTNSYSEGKLAKAVYDALILDIEKHSKKIIDEDHIEYTLNEMLTEIEQGIGICSFSLSQTKPILWGNYADCGRGIAVEFDIPESSVGITFFPVKYSEDRAVLSGSDLFLRHNEIFRTVLTTKSIDWCAEEEIRSFSKIPNVAFTVAGNIQSIILGPKISEEDANYIRQMNLNIPIHETCMSKTHFEVIRTDS